MPLSVQEKAEIIKKRAISTGDTGSPEVQIALISARLDYLQKHFGVHVKDQHSRLGLMKLVGRRRRLLDYLKGRDVQKYRELISELGIRK